MTEQIFLFVNWRFVLLFFPCISPIECFHNGGIIRYNTKTNTKEKKSIFRSDRFTVRCSIELWNQVLSKRNALKYSKIEQFTFVCWRLKNYTKSIVHTNSRQLIFFSLSLVFVLYLPVVFVCLSLKIFSTLRPSFASIIVGSVYTRFSDNWFVWFLYGNSFAFFLLGNFPPVKQMELMQREINCSAKWIRKNQKQKHFISIDFMFFLFFHF